MCKPSSPTLHSDIMTLLSGSKPFFVQLETQPYSIPGCLRAPGSFEFSYQASFLALRIASQLLFIHKSTEVITSRSFDPGVTRRARFQKTQKARSRPTMSPRKDTL
ncbi:hypothetical protein CDEST_09505 [Colletotrichum destructivum]|uniref:Uncharacterized protein n=1 Tax=Colletotrichum destructivum TaxID=34406 RepID=A0AAX4INM1_9PEZI|nr:hypothetical protein CDEST_09505 [Colletotrichum destructivum]